MERSSYIYNIFIGLMPLVTLVVFMALSFFK